MSGWDRSRILPNLRAGGEAGEFVNSIFQVLDFFFEGSNVLSFCRRKSIFQ
jgi:hypothetical protein